MKVYISKSIDPFYNIALEDWLLQEVLRDDCILYLWRNETSIIIGRSQNPWIECSKEVFLENVPIIRRTSGGGTVYHDKGNINYSFLSKKNKFSKTNNFKLILKTINTLGFKAYLSPREDIIVDQQGKRYKISGNAFYFNKDKVLHHGTLLIDSDTKKLEKYLHHNVNRSLNGRGVKSVRSSIINLKDIIQKTTVEKFISVLLSLNTTDITFLPKCINNPHLLRIQKKIEKWDWTFGKSLNFSQVIPFKENMIHLFVNEGKIQSINTDLEIFCIKDWFKKVKPRYGKFFLKEYLHIFHGKDRLIMMQIIKSIL